MEEEEEGEDMRERERMGGEQVRSNENLHLLSLTFQRKKAIKKKERECVSVMVTLEVRV